MMVDQSNHDKKNGKLDFNNQPNISNYGSFVRHWHGNEYKLKFINKKEMRSLKITFYKEKKNGLK